MTPMLQLQANQHSVNQTDLSDFITGRLSAVSPPGALNSSFQQLDNNRHRLSSSKNSKAIILPCVIRDR